MGPKQEPGPWGAGCFHGQAGDCQVTSSDEMWPQIKQCLLNTMWAWGGQDKPESLADSIWLPGPFTQCGGKKYSLTLILKINNRLFLCTILSCVYVQEKIKRMELYHNTKKGNQFSLLYYQKVTKMKNLLSLKKCTLKITLKGFGTSSWLEATAMVTCVLRRTPYS